LINKMTKKLNFVAIGVAYFLLELILFLFIPNVSIYLVISSFIVYIIAVWYLFSKIYDRKLMFDKFVYLILYLLASLLILSNFPNLGLNPKLAYILMSGGFSYLLMVALNIYIVTEKTGTVIPLLRPAKAVVFTSLMLSVFFGTTIIYKNLILIDYPLFHLFFKSFLFVLFYFLLFRFIKWFYIADGVGEQGIEKDILLQRLNIFSVVFMSQVSWVLMFSTFENFGRAVIVGGAFYIINNLVQNYLSHKIVSRFLYESFALLIFLYVIVSFL